ncbi:MAG: chloride channel protein [Planctomycetes bacterium]|nr:chloride channel protein [Planctomycetota bacterium]
MNARTLVDHIRSSAATGRLLILCVIIGAIAGVFCVAFSWLLETVQYYLLDGLAHHESEHPVWIWLLVLPAFGGLVSGVLTTKFAPEAAGPGTDAAVDAYHHHGGRVRTRVPFIKMITAAVTLGTGGSAGREGPLTQIGGGIGSFVATGLRLSNQERRILMAAGMAAGIGAMFHAPLAGALFAAEILYREMDLEHEVIVPSFIASIIAYSIYAQKAGWEPVYAAPHFHFRNALQLLAYAALAIVLAASATLFTRLWRVVRDAFSSLPVPTALKPAIGGLIAGSIGVFVPDALGTGHHLLAGAFASSFSIGFLILLVTAKMVTTSLTIGSGASGGKLGPSLVLGGSLGSIVGLVVQDLFPSLEIDAGAFVVVGMAGFFAAAANTPISTIIMVSELTGNYQLLVPSMLVCVLAYLFVSRHGIYDAQLVSRLEAPSKMGNMLGAVLKTIAIRDAANHTRDLIVVPEAMSLRQIIDLYTSSEQLAFPMVDPDGKLTGMIEGRDIRRAIAEEGVADLVVARDLARPHEVIDIESTLLDAVQRMTLTGLEDLILVEAEDPTRPVGVLEHQEVLHAYDRKLMEK